MRYAFLWASILAVALGWAVADEPMSSFQIAEKQREPTSSTVSGTVVSTSGYNLAIETKAGNHMDFELSSDSVLPAGIETGTQVSVSYRPGETGVSHVIEVTRFGAAPRESVPTTPAGGESAATRSAPVAQETTGRSRSEMMPRNERFRFPHSSESWLSVSVVAVGLFLRNRPRRMRVPSFI